MSALFVVLNYTWASARFRALWPAKHMQDAQVLTWDAPFPDCDAYIFEKAGDPALFQGLRKNGKRVFWDLCDPVYWWNPKDAAELACNCDGIVCSSPALRLDCIAWLDGAGIRTQAYCIPDRVDPDCYPVKRKHEKTGPVRFLWFGASQNRIAMFGGLANLERLAANGVNLALTIVDDQPEQPWNITDRFPVNYEKWKEDRENEIYASCDIAYLPPYPGAWGGVKSNNKTLTATLCGLPVTDGQDYQDMLRLASDPEYRAVKTARQAMRYQEYLEPERSAAAWEVLLS